MSEHGRHDHRNLVFRSFEAKDLTGLSYAGSERVVGDQEEVDNRLHELEEISNWAAQSHVIEETGVPADIAGGRSFVPPEKRHVYAQMGKQSPDPPDVVERTVIDRMLFARAHVDRRNCGRLARTLHILGVFSCADALAIGAHRLADWSYQIDQDTTANVLGSARIRMINHALLHATGHALPEGRATPDELHRYYADIGNASPVLALPTEHFAWYGALALRERRTVGELTSVTPGVLAGYSDYPALGHVVDFTMWHLVENVVRPFNRANGGS